MHVLLVPSWYPSFPGDPVGSFFREQAIALARSGIQVGVIYPELRSLRKWRSALERKDRYSISDDCGVMTFRRHGTNWFPRISSGAQHLWLKHGLDLFERYVDSQGRPDLLHVHSLLYAGVVGAEIRRRHHIPLIVTEHSSAFALGNVHGARLRVAAKVASEADVTLAVSDQLGKHLAQLSIGGNKWRALPNMVEEAFLAHPLAHERARSGFSFINVALANANKRQANVIRAFALSFREAQNASLVICGDGPELARLRKLAESLRIAHKVRFTGRVSRTEVVQELASADAFVMASAYETFGVALVESLALGKPVIATRCGGPESIVGDADGLLVPVDDIDSLSTAMVEVYEQIGRFDPGEIRSRCRLRFSASAVIGKLTEVYLDVSRSVPTEAT